MLNLFEKRFGRRLTPEEEDFLYRLGHDDGTDQMRNQWWICNNCGAPLIDGMLRHYCRRRRYRPFTRWNRNSAALYVEDQESNPRALEDAIGWRDH